MSHHCGNRIESTDGVSQKCLQPSNYSLKRTNTKNDCNIFN